MTRRPFSAKNTYVGNAFILVVVVITGLSFDCTNGFHDSANAVATSITPVR